MRIEDENKNIICSDGSIFTNQYSKNIGNKIIENDDNHMKFLVYMYTDNFPKSKTLNIRFSKVALTKKLKYKEIINSKVNLKIDLDEKFVNRNSTLYTSENPKIEKAIITETGFYAMIKLEHYAKEDDIILMDSNNNSYKCYVNILTYEEKDDYEYIVIANFTNSSEEKLKLIVNGTEYPLNKTD